jgi:hypothetical protein
MRPLPLPVPQRQFSHFRDEKRWDSLSMQGLDLTPRVGLQALVSRPVGSSHHSSQAWSVRLSTTAEARAGLVQVVDIDASVMQGNFDLVYILVVATRVALVPFTFVYGWVLISTWHLHQAYGMGVAGYGLGEYDGAGAVSGTLGSVLRMLVAGLILLSMTDGLSILVGWWGVKRHNKFLLALVSTCPLAQSSWLPLHTSAKSPLHGSTS